MTLIKISEEITKGKPCMKCQCGSSCGYLMWVGSPAVLRDLKYLSISCLVSSGTSKEEILSLKESDSDIPLWLRG